MLYAQLVRTVEFHRHVVPKNDWIPLDGICSRSMDGPTLGCDLKKSQLCHHRRTLRAAS